MNKPSASWQLVEPCLLQAREQRVRPGWDDKVLADWNGLIIAAMANAGIVFEQPDWIETARRAFDLIRREMTVGDGRLLHSWRAGRARHPANVDDYANLCRAALALQEATGDETFLSQARDWIAVLDRHYWDEAGGGYFFAAKDTEGLIARAKTAADSAVPAGNGTLVGVLTRLAILTGEEAYRRRAETIVETFSGEVARNFFPLATLLNNVELLEKPLQIVIVGERKDPLFQALLRAVYNVSLPNRVVLTLPPGASLPVGHPAHGKGLVDGKPAAYVCEGPVAHFRSPIPDSCSKLSAGCVSVLSFQESWRNAMAHAIRFEKTGGPEVLTWQAVEVGKPGQGQVRLRHTAVGLNYIDTYQRSGLYQLPLPSGLGSEGAGVIEEVGPGVSGLKPGDRVAYAGGPLGAYADERVMPADRLVPVPDGITDQQAAAMMLKGMTAWYLVRRTHPVKRGETILIHAAAGGVGLIVCQWAKHLGATVIGTVGDEAKARLAKRTAATTRSSTSTRISSRRSTI